MKEYKFGWVITKDLVEEGRAVGTIGPRICTKTEKEIIQKGSHFKMFDDDDTLCYEGYVLHDDGEELFNPLDNFGEPNAGCTYIKVKNSNGIYKTV